MNAITLAQDPRRYYRADSSTLEILTRISWLSTILQPEPILNVILLYRTVGVIYLKKIKNQFCNNTRNTYSRRERFNIGDLPRTFQDVIRVSRELS
jgi:hypothetical protein